jgi:hypothetical protein
LLGVSVEQEVNISMSGESAETRTSREGGRGNKTMDSKQILPVAPLLLSHRCLGRVPSREERRRAGVCVS